MNKILLISICFFLNAQDSTLVLWNDSETFTIDSQNPTINWEYPNGGEQFEPGEIVTGTWSAEDMSFSELPIQILVSNSIGDVFYPLTDNIENSGSADISLANQDLQFVRIKTIATDDYGNQSSDYSDGYFTIGNPVIPGGGDSTLVILESSTNIITDSKNPVVNLNTPNGGEQFDSGEELAVQWTAEDDSFGNNPIDIGQSLGIGSPFISIAEDLGNTGNYLAILPSINEMFARLRVTAIDEFGNQSSDYSDGYYTIGNPVMPGGGDSTLVVSEHSNFTMIDSKDPEIQLLYPNGGEILPANMETDISWDASDDSFEETPISVSFSEGIGIAYTPISDPLENDGLESILLPDIITDNGRIKVTAIDQFGNTNSDESDDYISVQLAGCTDPDAFNFNENHGIDDGSCEYLGDCNYDTIVDINDIILMVQEILYIIELDDNQLLLADVNQDGEVNITDIIIIVNYILGNDN